jgi:FKBP-type peptidyl-prolyl cis-trans isomerase FkpA
MRLMFFFAMLLTAAIGSACSNDAAPSGVDIPTLQVLDRTTGTGTDATFGRLVTVHYTGWLYSTTAAGNKGTQFDSSRTLNQPFSFVLGTGNVIQGWHQGIVGMRVGGTRTLLIPASLAYGSAGRGSIPPNSALVFDVELLTVQ